jgi:hypothetical protein
MDLRQGATHWGIPGPDVPGPGSNMGKGSRSGAIRSWRESSLPSASRVPSSADVGPKTKQPAAAQSAVQADLCPSS